MITLKQDALILMNLALVGTACGQILTLLEFAFGYLESKESEERGKQLEELERQFESDNDFPAEEDTVSKSQGVMDAVAQFADTDEPKPKCKKFGKCHDSLKSVLLYH